MSKRASIPGTPSSTIRPSHQRIESTPTAAIHAPSNAMAAFGPNDLEKGCAVQSLRVEKSRPNHFDWIRIVPSSNAPANELLC
jgi:hypothetical protein